MIIKEVLTWLINLKSWLTRTRPPSKSFTASAKASIVSISKWLVGSSSSKRWGACHANQAKTTLHLCPSDNWRIGQTYKITIHTTLNYGLVEKYWKRHLKSSQGFKIHRPFWYFIFYMDILKILFQSVNLIIVHKPF